MDDPDAARAVELLIEQADVALVDGRYAAALATAERASEAADQLDHPNLLLRALEAEADALRMSGDAKAALARYTRILGMAEEPAVTAQLDRLATWVIALAYANWVVEARFVGGIPVRELFGVLDAADRWLTATGHPDWRAPVLLQRASLHRDLGEWDQAVAAARDALAAYRPDAPGYTLGAHRFELGDILSDAGRSGEAEPLYQAILDDPTSIAYERGVAWHGLSRCALARGDFAAAVRHARAAVLQAEPLSEDLLAGVVVALVAALRAAGDLDAAVHAADRGLRAARRIGTPSRLYLALRDAVDVALDRNDHATATTLLDELDRHAAALDTASRTTTCRDEAAKRHTRLAGSADEL